MVLKTIPKGIKLPIQQGVDLINAAIEAADKASTDSNTAVNTANNAKSTAEQAITKSESTQKQVDDLILFNGESDAEIIQARGEHDLLYKRLDSTNTQLTQNENDLKSRAINIMHPPVPLVGAKGDGITDDTNAIKGVVALGKNVYAPIPEVGYLISDTITLVEGQTYFGVGILSKHIFNFVDSTRDYFLINTPYTHVKDIGVTCNQTGDTLNSCAIVMRKGAKNSSIENTFVENVPATAYAAEETVDCEIKNVISIRARRHGIYIIANDNITVDQFYVYKNKLESVVLRGKMVGVITGYVIKNGLIDGVHEETTYWNGITLAQHSNQAGGEFYKYQDIIFENIVLKNPFTSAGYGSFFSTNGETIENSKFKNLTFYGVNGTHGIDLRNIKNSDIQGITVYDAFGNGITVANSEGLTIEDINIINPVTGGNANQAGLLVDGTSKNINIGKIKIHDTRETKLCNYGVRVLDGATEVKVSKLDAVGMKLKKVDFVSRVKNKFGTHFVDVPFVINNLTDGTSGSVATGSGGTGVYLSSVEGYFRSISVNVNELPTVGNARFQLRHNDTVVIATVTIDSTTGKNVSLQLNPTDYPINAGDRISIVYYVENGWDKPNSDATILVSLASD